MAYMKATPGGGGGGGLFPAKGKALTISGFCYESTTIVDISSSFSFSQGGTSQPVYAIGVGFIANIEDTGYTDFTTSGAQGAYAYVGYFDKDGAFISGGRNTPNGAHSIPSGTCFVVYMTNNYNNTTGGTVSVSFS